MKSALNILIIKAIPFSGVELFPLRVTKKNLSHFLKHSLFYLFKAIANVLFFICIKLVLTALCA